MKHLNQKVVRAMFSILYIDVETLDEKTLVKVEYSVVCKYDGLSSPMLCFMSHYFIYVF